MDLDGHVGEDDGANEYTALDPQNQPGAAARHYVQ